MKLFHFYRIEDHSGVSGTGAVVEGVQFTNGWCVLRWISGKSSICFYRSIEDVKAIHGHEGKTEIVVHDFEPLGQARHRAEDSRFDLLMEIIDVAAHLTTIDKDPDQLSSDALMSIAMLRDCINRLERSLGMGSPGKGDQPRSA
jgi:hypothetical protein